jgi:Tfp pilus assembly protein PilO
MTTREKRMLLACLLVLLIAGTAIAAQRYIREKTALETTIRSVRVERDQAQAWIGDRELMAQRREWLDAALPSFEAMGPAQGALLEDLQNAIADLGFRIERTNPTDAVKTPHYQEVSVSLNIRGDQALAMQWLATLASPDQFQFIKALEIDPDGRAKEKTPQAFVNLTVARWFKPEGQP